VSSRVYLLGLSLLCLSLIGCGVSMPPTAEQEVMARQQIEVGDKLLNESRFERAYAAYSNAYSLTDSSSALVGMGAAKVGMGEVSEGERFFQQVLEKDPSNAYAYGNLGVVAAIQGKRKKAIEFYTQALRLDPSAFQFLNNLAVEEYRQGADSEVVLGKLLQALALQAHPRVEKNVSLLGEDRR
jgi:Tfp pilus assembly protein PilF